MKIEKFSYSPNRIITQEVIDYINKVIENENVYNQKIKEYNALPKCVQDCIPYEDIGYFEEAIYNASKYNKNVYRLDCLEPILQTSLVKGWLSKMDINTLCKDQKTLDLFAIYVAKRLVKFIPSIEKDIFEKEFSILKKRMLKYGSEWLKLLTSFLFISTNSLYLNIFFDIITVENCKQSGG